jgi:hypothetical protein
MNRRYSKGKSRDNGVWGKWQFARSMSKGVGWSDQTVTFSVPKKRRTPDFIPDLYVMYVSVCRLLHISYVCAVCGWRDAVCRNMRDSAGLDWTGPNLSLLFSNLFYYSMQ